MKQKEDAPSYKVSNVFLERFVWLIKPIGLVFLIVWSIHPHTATVGVEDNVLLAVLMGALYALFIKRETLKLFWAGRFNTGRERKNRVPDEFYWGQVKQVLFRKGE